MFHDCITDKLRLLGDMVSVVGGSTRPHDNGIPDNYNVDQALNENIHTLFGDNRMPEAKEEHPQISPLIELLQQKEKSAFFDNWTTSRSDLSKAPPDTVEEKSSSILHYGVNGKHFSLADKPGEKTLVFEVIEDIDPLSQTYCAKAKELETTEKSNPNGTISRTYYIDEPRSDGDSLLFITISDQRVVLNNGVLYYDKVIIAKDPQIHPLHDFYAAQNINSSIVNATSVTNEKLEQAINNIIDCEASIDSHVYLIDIGSRSLLRRNLVFDNQDKQWHTIIPINARRPYFAFEIWLDQGLYKNLTDIQRGAFFLEGLYGFPKDIGMAASLFEKDNSAEALLGIAYIFLCEPLYKDLELGVQYLNKAIENGSSRAKIEMALLHLERNENHSIKELLLSADSDDDALASFLLGVFLEIGIIENSQPDQCFDYYLKSAMKEFVPAQIRLGKRVGASPDEWIEEQDKEELKTNYLTTSSKVQGLAEFLLGAVLLSGKENFTHRELGISYLEKSIEKGNQDATFELYDFYVDELLNKRSVDISKLTRCSETVLSFIDDPKELNKKANTMLDVEPSIPDLDGLSMKFLEKAIELAPEYGVAINNLGWMIKKGRGVEQNYDKAKELFEKAASLGASASYFHLGDMYENGLGVDKSLEKAIEYYQKGAELENKKCRERLDVLVPASTDETDGYLKKIYEYVVKTNAKVMEIGELTQEMKVLLEKITDIQSEISSRKAIFQSQENGEDSIEEAYKQFVDSMAETMCRKLYQSGNPNVDFEENTLKGIFGDYYDCLDDYTRRSLVSARVFLSGSNSLSRESLDYSGVVISATSALENELKLRFFDGYQAYLRNRFKSDFSKWPKSMVYDGRTENTVFTIGSLPGIFGSRQRGDNGKRFFNKKMSVTPAEKALLDEYLKTILYRSDDDINVFFKEDHHGLNFMDRCEDVRCMYRNAAAHTESLSLEKATDCCRDIIGFDRYDAAQKVGRIQGLILDLAKLSKLPSNNNH